MTLKVAMKIKGTPNGVPFSVCYDCVWILSSHARMLSKDVRMLSKGVRLLSPL